MTNDIQPIVTQASSNDTGLMDKDTVSRLPGGIDQEVDLLEYLHAVLRRKYSLTAVAFLGAMVMFAMTFSQSNIYFATAVLAINIDDKPGGVAPKEYRSGDTLGLLERDFVINSAAANERERIMARMRSARFSELFITENNLLPYIFFKQWDATNQKWKEDFRPDIRVAIKAFNDGMRGIQYDEKSGLLLVSFKTRDPVFSAELANKFVLRFNLYARGLALDELADRRSYLETRLREIQNLELQRSIFRLLETQLAAETLINARKSFPLEEIQPAVPPLLKMKPKRLFTAALSFVGFMFLGLTLIIGSVLYKKISQGLGAYAAKVNPANLPKIEPRSQGILDRFRRKKDSKTDAANEWVD
ncbi:MAG: hypothetical protein Q8M33_04560 [Hydrogenophaga sp.]|nr:hypothetical protein [Hydrogenophaga sp.]